MAEDGNTELFKFYMYIQGDEQLEVKIQAPSCTPATTPDDIVATAGLPLAVT